MAGEPSSSTLIADSQDAGHVPFRLVLASIIGLWATYFVLVTLRGHLIDLEFAPEILWRRALACLLGMLITLGLWLILRLFDRCHMAIKIVAALLVSLPVAVVIAQANHLVFQPVEEEAFRNAVEKRGFTVRRSATGDLLLEIPTIAIPALDEGAPARPATIPATALKGTYWQEITEITFGRYFMLLAWCALYLALLTGERARAAERREGAYRRAAKAAELRSLRYQVNPHFLFNTLNSLSALVLTGKAEAAERMIQTMSTFYRRSLAADPTADVPLAEEIALQRLYLDIEAVRFPQRLRVHCEIPPELADALVPGMILQPLVENAVKHAVAPSPDPVTISLIAREEYGRLVITIADDGTAKAKDPARPGHGIGLGNVRERLQARFGKEATLVSGRVPGGYATHIRLPILRASCAPAAGRPA